MSDPVRFDALRTRARISRRAQRAAALVEAAFMLPMFVILFYASLYAHNLGYNYMVTNRQSRATSWAYAMTNCGDTSDNEVEVLPQVNSGGGAGEATKISPMPTSPTPPSGGGGGGIGGMLTGLEGTIADTVASVFPDPNGSQATNTTNLSWKDPNLYAGGGGLLGGATQNTTKITQAVTVDCDNAAHAGGAVNTAILLGKDIGSMLGL